MAALRLAALLLCSRAPSAATGAASTSGADGRRLEWSVLVHGPNARGGGPGDGGAIAVGVGYIVSVGLRRCVLDPGRLERGCGPAAVHGCDTQHLSRELNAFGQLPRISVDAPGTHEWQLQLQLQPAGPHALRRAPCAVWEAALPLDATAAPAALRIAVADDMHGIGSLSIHGTTLHTAVIAAAAAASTAGTLLYASVATPLDLSADVAVARRSIPGVSPVAFLDVGSNGIQDALCVTEDEFRSHYWVDLRPSSPTGTGAVSCMGGVGAVHTRSALIYHSPSGGIEEIQSSTRRVSLSDGLLGLCVDQLVVGSQPTPYHRPFNDIVVALEPPAWRQGTGATVFLRGATATAPAGDAGAGVEASGFGGRFRELVDSRGVELATWASQLFTSIDARKSLEVIAATFAVTQPDDFLFLIESLSSAGHAHILLVAFDGTARRWSRRSIFPGEVATTLRLVGLQYASSTRPVLWTWGTTVLYSLDHGHTFHRVLGLAQPVPSNPVVGFASTTTDEWALLYTDGSVILGGTDSQPRPAMLIPAAGSSRLVSSVFFSQEGALVSLGIVCSETSGDQSQGVSEACTPQRQTLAWKSEAWEVRDFH